MYIYSSSDKVECYKVKKGSGLLKKKDKSFSKAASKQLEQFPIKFQRLSML